MAKRVFITGASGCVGHYIVESLLHNTDYELFLLLRDRQKLRVDTKVRPGVTAIEGGMQDMAYFKELLPTMNYVISAAAAWGGTVEVFETNVYRTIELFEALDPQVCERAIYFSTASILDDRNQILKEAETIGTDYIRSKHACLQKLEKTPISDRLITVFPTLVFGGDGKTKPYSHLSSGLKQVASYINLIKCLKADGSFHFVHGADIAQVITYLLTAEQPLLGDLFPTRLVLGAPRLTVNQAVREACDYLNKKVGWQIDLTPSLVNILIKVFNIKVAAWDMFCIKQRHFTYDVVNPESFGLTSKYPHIANLLAEM
jgi:nucleoside-diphosphate-sugar epimerase